MALKMMRKNVAMAAMLVFSCASAACLAQVVVPPGTWPQHILNSPGHGGVPPVYPPSPINAPVSHPAPVAPAANTTPAPVMPSGVPTSLLDKPAQPAQISLAPGHLAVKADNSSLTEILNKVSSLSGMRIDGLNRDQRIFGDYGPGEPQEVLYSLLAGSGYNVVMLGVTSDGVPKEVTLTPRGAAVGSGQGQQPPVSHDDEPDEDVQPQAQAPEPPPQIPVPPSNPGQQQQGGVKTPQQMLQELQQMRQQQQQNQQPQ